MKSLVLIMFISACSIRPGHLTEKAKDVEIYVTKPTNCFVVGKVVGEDQNGSTELAKNDALNQAAKLKATGIFVDQEVPNGKKRSVFATAYDCR